MNVYEQTRLRSTRREFFGRTATGIGTAALASLLAKSGLANGPDIGTGGKVHGGLPGLPHFAPSAKRVIALIQNGAPSHADLFDWKPELARMHGQPVPESYVAGKRFSTMTGQADGKLMLAPIEPFHQRGNSGAWVSDMLPFTAGIADELTFVKGMYTDAVNHAPAISFLLSGAPDSRSSDTRRVDELRARFGGRRTAELHRDDLGFEEHDLRPDLLRFLLG